VTFTPTDTTDYNTVAGSVSVVVNQATPTVSAWPTAGAIAFGQTLASSPLSGGTASVPGTFSWTTPATAPATGTASEGVTFTATDATDYNTVPGSVSVTVNKATPAVSAWPAATAITYGQTLALSTLTGGAASVPGAFSWTTPTIAPSGGTPSEGVTFTPTDGADYNTATGSVSVTVSPALPNVTVTPGSSSITTAQALTVTVAVSGGGNPAPTGSVTLSSGTYTSAATTLASGSASINVPAGVLAAGTDTLTASYTPDANSSSNYKSASGTALLTVAALIVPTITVTPGSNSITTAQALSVTVAVSGGGSNPTPTGAVTLSSGTYTSAATTLSSGGATINVPAGSLAAGSDTLTATYAPDAASFSTYNKATGTSSAVTVTLLTTVAVNLSSTGPAVTDQLLGMNLAAWYDVVGNATAVNGAFAQAGIQAIRWPGGSWSDEYHWQTPNNSSNPNLPFMCHNNSSGVPDGSTTWGGYSTFGEFVTSIVQGGNYDLALTADYGTDTACTGPGVPSEAEAWVAAAVTDGIHVSHVTVGNEEYGTWETDLHTAPHDPKTYAAAVAGASGYYALIKAASPNTLVGVDVEEDNETGGWDNTVLANAKGSYDFVEYHYYPETPGKESDTFITQQAAQELTTNINTIKSELAKWGTPDTPIYVGEIGGPYSNPGKQSWSITQGLYAGQVLGEMMNDGVSRLTWWIGFGNCNGTGTPSDPANLSASLYGWQDWGAYNIFSDGPSDTTCPGAGPIGTLSPTAVAFQLFSNVAVTGENVLTPTVAGDTTDVRAYAATHSGGTALVLFNLNATVPEPVTVALSGQSSSTGVTVITYDKAIYDLSGSPTGFFPDPAGTSTWAGPTTTSLGAQSLPLSLTLVPWSMNVVIIH
jgi:hypothetical protein